MQTYVVNYYQKQSTGTTAGVQAISSEQPDQEIKPDTTATNTTLKQCADNDVVVNPACYINCPFVCAAISQLGLTLNNISVMSCVRMYSEYDTLPIKNGLLGKGIIS